jgi:signal transduction histidine kinase
MINVSGRHMAKMVENLLDIYKIEQGQIISCLDTIDLVSVIKQSMADFNEHALKKKINMHFSTNLDKALIVADPTLTKRVLENLISNSLKFSPVEKSIFINLEKNDDIFIIGIKDEGPGLTEEDKPKLFQKFSRLSATPTSGEHSTGLGLSIVKSLVEVMKGKVWCESDAGKGACFYLSFSEKKV